VIDNKERVLTSRVTETFFRQVEAEAGRRKLATAELVRQAVEAFLVADKRQANMERIIYEIVKTRACIIRIADLPEEDEGRLLEEAGKDAEAALEGKREAA
jgi:predicted transcriptional regulator